MHTAHGILMLSLVSTLVLGCGGGDAPDPPAVTFTQVDHDICVNWPLCPTGVVALGAGVPSTSCQSVFGIHLSCGGCVDTRTPSCAPFVGRCMAMNWPIRQPDYCGDQVAPAHEPVDAYTVCTGIESDGGAAAHLVCDAAP